MAATSGAKLADETDAVEGGAPPEDVGPKYDTPTPQDIPALSDFLGSLSSGEASSWGNDVAQSITDWMTKQAVAAQNTQLGQNLVDDVSAFRDMMTGLIRQNPTATGMAIGVGERTADALVNDHPFLPEADRPKVAAALKSELGEHFARNGIMAAAQRSGEVAHDMLNSFGHLFTDTNVVEALASHIDMAALWRTEDQKQALAIQAKNKADISTNRLMKYAGTLVDDRGEATIPPKFNTQAFLDQGLSPKDSDAAMKLAQYAAKAAGAGEAEVRTSADTMLNFLKGFATGTKRPEDALKLAGAARLQDAVLLSRLTQNPEDAGIFGSLLAAKKRQLMGPDKDLFGASANSKLDAYGHNLLLKYKDLGKAAFEGAEDTGVLQQPERLLGYRKLRELNEIYQNPSAPAAPAVAVLRGGGDRVSVPGAELKAQTATENYMSVRENEHKRAIEASKIMTPQEARQVWVEGQRNIEAARVARDDAHRALVDERDRAHREAVATAKAQAAAERKERRHEADALRQHQAQQAADAAAERAAERHAAAEERRQARIDAELKADHGRAGPAEPSPLDAFRRGYRGARGGG